MQKEKILRRYISFLIYIYTHTYTKHTVKLTLTFKLRYSIPLPTQFLSIV